MLQGLAIFKHHKVCVQSKDTSHCEELKATPVSDTATKTCVKDNHFDSCARTSTFLGPSRVFFSYKSSFCCNSFNFDSMQEMKVCSS